MRALTINWIFKIKSLSSITDKGFKWKAGNLEICGDERKFTGANARKEY